MSSSWLPCAWLWLFTAVVSCATTEQQRRGDELLAQGNPGEAIVAYERALRDDPESTAATEGLRRARRQAVQGELRRAKEALSDGDEGAALYHATKALRMPLDLEAVTLIQDLD